MIIPVRCFTCGNLVADKYSEFVSRVKGGEEPKKVLDSLGLKRYCCRRMLISAMDVIDQLMPYNEALWKRHLEFSNDRF
ncbi:MAG TPA: DNA-directed RNA polymerase subunit N [Nitrososphaerales archaeon]|nr:DNA-directed RNA polymerase subunit N [Nitrososphaerales archaeon]